MARKMRDSGVDWIGKIPEDTKLMQFRYIADISTGNMDTQNRDDNGTYPFYVRSPKVERSKEYSFDDVEAILMAGDGVGAGRIFHYVQGKYACHQRVYRLNNFHHVNSKFLKYYLEILFPMVMEYGSAKSTVDSVRLPMLKSFWVVIFNESEQQKIANYLDEKVFQIDSVIAKTKETIEDYKRYKQAIITETVTKGLNSDVDMKNTGNIHIPEIPQTWDMKRLKYVFYIKKDIAGEEGYKILSITQKGIKIKDITKNEGQLAADYSKYQKVEVGDFAMNHMDLLTGWVDVSKYSGVTSPDYRVFRFIDTSNFSTEYYLYLMQMCYMNRIFYGLGQGVSNLGRWRLQADKFLNFTIPVPPFEEQKQIAEYLNKKCSEIDNLISQKTNLIEDVEAYKKSLIYEYVTGKKVVE